MRSILREAGFEGLPTSGTVGLVIISLFSGLVTGIAEALGACLFVFSVQQRLRAACFWNCQILADSMTI